MIVMGGRECFLHRCRPGKQAVLSSDFQSAQGAFSEIIVDGPREPFLPGTSEASTVEAIAEALAIALSRDGQELFARTK